MRNQDIKAEMKKSKLKYWEIAEALGLTDGMFSKKLRKELSKEEKDKIRSAISKLKSNIK